MTTLPIFNLVRNRIEKAITKNEGRKGLSEDLLVIENIVSQGRRDHLMLG